MERARIVQRCRRALPVAAVQMAALAVAAATPVLAWGDGVPELERGDTLRAALAAPVPRMVPRLAVAKTAAFEAPAVSAAACAGCRDGIAPARPLFPALPGGESYELRILKGAVSGFAVRLSGTDSATSPDERLRIRISRQRVGVSWQRSF